MFKTAILQLANQLCETVLTFVCIFFFLSSYGECVMPHKVQDKPDVYQGQWRDGKIHGFGKYKSVSVLFKIITKVQSSSETSCLNPKYVCDVIRSVWLKSAVADAEI